MSKIKIVTTLQITEEVDYSPDMYPGYPTVDDAAKLEYGLGYDEMLEGITQTLDLADGEKVVRIDEDMEFPTDVPSDSVVYKRAVTVIPD